MTQQGKCTFILRWVSLSLWSAADARCLMGVDKWQQSLRDSQSRSCRAPSRYYTIVSIQKSSDAESQSAALTFYAISKVSCESHHRISTKTRVSFWIQMVRCGSPKKVPKDTNLGWISQHVTPNTHACTGEVHAPCSIDPLIKAQIWLSGFFLLDF